MKILLSAAIATMLLGVPAAGAQPGQNAPDPVVYAVSYIEVLPSASATAVAALQRYRDASRTQDGFVRLDLFEQAGRRGHFSVVEAWRDQKAFDAHQASAQTALLDALAPIRVSAFDQRPYKPLAVAASPSAVDRRAVSVVTHVDVSPNPQVAVLLKRLADDSRRDQGNQRFDVVQHAMRANHFTVIETWQSQQALDAHAAAAHTKQYRDELQPMTGSPLDERVYTAVD